jgi:hypothetical protein
MNARHRRRGGAARIIEAIAKSMM